jgi:sugar O-acyltransferase (sialic acid O-acetyltransferase NeuD family)
MKITKDVFLLGLSGHALSVLDAMRLNDIHPKGYYDKVKNKQLDLHYCGDETIEENLISLDHSSFIFPAVGDNSLREKLILWAQARRYNELFIQHPTAILALDAQVGLSTFIGAGSIVNAHVKIGKGAIINTGAIIEHECTIGDFAHIGPGAVLAGNVRIEKSCFIGANATVKQGVKIGANTIIGAGSVVLTDIPANTVYAGNPAKQIKKG